MSNKPSLNGELCKAVIIGGIYLTCWLVGPPEKKKEEEYKGAPKQPALKREESQEARNHSIEYAADLEIESMTCPITQELIVEPASTVYGHVYELSAIKHWVQRKGRCPMTQKPLREDQIIP